MSGRVFVGIAKSKSEVLDSGFSVMSLLGEGDAAAADDDDDDDDNHWYTMDH